IGNIESGSVSQSYATGNVTATQSGMTFAERAGGLVGNINSGSVRNSFATGNVSSVTNSGGLVGFAGSLVVIENSYSLSNNNSGLIFSGGVISNSYFNQDLLSWPSTKPEARTTAQMKNQSTYVGWDFENIWMMNGSYPKLRAFSLFGMSGAFFIFGAEFGIICEDCILCGVCGLSYECEDCILCGGCKESEGIDSDEEVGDEEVGEEIEGEEVGDEEINIEL
ncbi:MAG: hypothetical protein FWE14_06050, partial [Lachnospiraceae bacterium]|nr:hypothetical protein [Lachnospiraceae bacterium]